MKTTLLSLFTVTCLSGAFAQVPNAGFETWQSNFMAPQEPVGYVTSNVFASPFINGSNPTSATKVTAAGDFYSGLAAMRLETVKLITNPSPQDIPDTNGAAILGAINVTSGASLKEGAPYTTRAANFSFYYKYTPVAGDNGGAISYLTKWMGTYRDTVAVAFIQLTSAASAYTLANTSYTYTPTYATSGNPDSVRIYFASSLYPWITSAPHPKLGSVLYVDDAAVIGIPTKSYNNSAVTTVFPNPATSYVNFVCNDNPYVVEIYNLAGVKIATQQFAGRKAHYNSDSLDSGMYLFMVRNEEGKLLSTGKFNIAK